MEYLKMILLCIFYIFTPLFVFWLCEKSNVINKIGAIIIIYGIGLVVGLLNVIPKEIEGIKTVQDLLSTLVITISIPMMLFSTNFRAWSYSKTLKVASIGIGSVLFISLIGSAIFFSLIKDNTVLNEEFYKISGVLVGVYTGGTPNLAALKHMLDLQENMYILVQSYDVVICLLLMLFLITVGIKFFRWLLDNKMKRASRKNIVNDPLKIKLRYGKYDDRTTYKNLTSRRSRAPLLLSFLVSICIGVISIVISLLFDSSVQVVVVMLSVTTLGILASFIKKINQLKRSYDLGLYLVLIFSLIIATMVDLNELFVDGSLILLGYVTFVIFGSLTLHMILAKIFKIDADTSVIASVALIYAPPFIPMIAASMRNKDVLITGLTIGVLGYAVGNYLGYIMAKIVQYILPMFD